VVAGGDHDDRDEQRIRNAAGPDEAVVTVLDQLPAAPQCPCDMQRRHRGELVREPAEAAWGARISSPPPNTGEPGHRVDEAGEHARRSDWGGSEDREAGECGQQEHGAGTRIGGAVVAPHPHEHDRGDQVVQRRVGVVGGGCEQKMRRHKSVEGLFPGDVERLLDM
jgi:hypothetical protein